MMLRLRMWLFVLKIIRRFYPEAGWYFVRWSAWDDDVNISGPYRLYPYDRVLATNHGYFLRAKGVFLYSAPDGAKKPDEVDDMTMLDWYR